MEAWTNAEKTRKAVLYGKNVCFYLRGKKPNGVLALWHRETYRTVEDAQAAAKAWVERAVMIDAKGKIIGKRYRALSGAQQHAKRDAMQEACPA
jgi:hypothetical protein